MNVPAGESMLHPSDSATAVFQKVAGSVEAMLNDIAKLPGTLLPAEGRSEEDSKALTPILARLQRQLTSDLAEPIAGLLEEVRRLASTPRYRCVFVGQPSSGAPFLSVDQGKARFCDYGSLAKWPTPPTTSYHV